MKESQPFAARNGRIGFSGFIKDFERKEGAVPPPFDTVMVRDVTVINHSTAVTVKDSDVKDEGTAKPGEHGDFLYEHGAMKEHR